jgi:ABC-type transporter Mla MlaB component
VAGPEDSAASGMDGPCSGPNATVVVLGGPITGADIPDLCECVRILLKGSGAERAVCDVGGMHPDAATLDVLARLQLTAHRLGCQIQLRRARDELQGLLALTGLSEVLPVVGALRLEPSGKAEERKQARGVEEEADPGDLTARDLEHLE